MVHCKDCRYWDYTNDQSGFCRRGAPRPAPLAIPKGQMGVLEFTLVWPSTAKDDSCGEGEPIEEADAGNGSIP